MHRYLDVCDGRHGNSCYVIVSESLTWQNARSKCESTGGHLATIDSQAENDVILNIAASKFYNRNILRRIKG